MAKFCGKCGSNLDEATGLCPNCDSDKLNKQISKPESVEKSKPRQNTIPESEKPLSKKRAKKKRKTDKKAEKKENRTQWPIGKKCCRFILKLMLSVLLLGVFVFGGTGVLVYFNILEVPIVYNVLERTGFKQELSAFSNQEINDSEVELNYTPENSKNNQQGQVDRSALINQPQEPVRATLDDGDMKERDRAIYNQYLTNGGYEELIGDTENLDISSVMYDVNGDETYELLLEIIDTSTLDPKGQARLTFLLGIEDGSVKEYQSAYFTGETMFDSFIYFLYDTETQKPVVIVNNAVKAGISCYQSETKIFSNDFLVPEMTWWESSFVRINGGFSDYEDNVNEIRQETAPYFDNGTVFVGYKVNDQYVTEDELEQVADRFVYDDSIPELFPGTYDEPVAVLDLSSKESPSDDNYKDVIAEGASWREVYKNVLGSLTEEFSGYGLIYVDNNDVPELYLRGNGKDQRDRLYSISDGRLVETSNGGQLEYWETQGIFQYWSFQQNVSRTDCYIMENGNVKKVHVGSYHEQSGSTEYFWDGKPVSKDQYIHNLDAASDSQGDTLGREYSSSLEEILSQMEDTSIEGQILKKSIEDSLNIHSFPRHDSDLAGTVDSSSEVLTYNGATAEGLGSDGEMHNWHYVTTGTGVSGWIRGDLIVPDSGSLKMLDQSLRYYRKSVEESLNIRSLPQYDSNLVGTVSSLYEPLAFYGEIGVGYGSDGIMHEWYKITTSSGITGWVRSDLIWEEVG